MGRGKHCSYEKICLIKRLREKGKTLKEIAGIMDCSINMVSNAIKKQKQPETRGRKRKTSKKNDEEIVQQARKNPFRTSKDIKNELGLEIDASTVRKRLIEHNLAASLPKKCPQLSTKNVKHRKKFSKEHSDWPVTKWRNILWSDETKINLFGSDSSKKYVRRPPCKEYDPRYTIKTVKHGGGNIMVWGCFSQNGVGPIHWIKETMTKEVYRDILENTMLPFAEENMPLLWIFQQDNDPKHSSKLVKEWFSTKKVKVMEWPSQSPDLNPIENLWGDVKRALGKLPKPKNRQELWENVQNAWKDLPATKCQKLVDSMTRRCHEVLKNKGFTTKY